MARKAREPKAEAFVLDCSVTMAWYFKDEAHAYANAIRTALGGVAAVVPALWPLEVANILVMGERRKRSTEAEARVWLEYVRRLPIRVEDETPARAWSDILHVARHHELSVYDAAYLELAIRLGLPLATLDEELTAAAGAAGVANYHPRP
jgi:predicted nucleic acid-binding protein